MKKVFFPLLAIVLVATSCIPTKRICRQFSQQAIYQVDWSEWMAYLKDSTLSPCLERDSDIYRDPHFWIKTQIIQKLWKL